MKNIDGFVHHMKSLSTKVNAFSKNKVNLSGLSYEDWKFYIKNYNEILALTQAGIYHKIAKYQWQKELYEPITVDDIKTVKEKLGVIL
jgi:hypothetical protein